MKDRLTDSGERLKIALLSCEDLSKTYQGRASKVKQRVVAHVVRKNLVVRSKELAFLCG